MRSLPGAERSSSSPRSTPGRVFLSPQVGEEPLRLGVMVGDRHPGLVEAVQDRGVQLDECPVAPQAAVRGHVEAHVPRDCGAFVVPAGVPEVPGSDFGSHVPAVERRARVPDAASGQEHIGDHRDGMPAQPKVCEPWVAGMGERYLKHGVRRDSENPRPVPGRLDDQRQHVKAATGPGPAEPVS